MGKAAGTSSRSLSARQRARHIMDKEVALMKKRQKALTDVFVALDARDRAEQQAGVALVALKELGESNADLADKTGLSAREIAALLSRSEGADRDDSTGGGDESTDGSRSTGSVASTTDASNESMPRAY
ncbi:hypothetical protein MTQ17_09935 [Corynebacterium bovis]|uniref:hypothetical protein n=1 Tax=Corynebacterium bovis TaxID=36808 RepID=UPI00313A27D2